MADISKIKPNGASGTEYNLKDATARAAMIPSGGTQGQVLVKKTGTDYDTEWATGGGGGTDVEGNPSGSVTSGDLTKIKIGNNIYRVTDLSAIVAEFDPTETYTKNVDYVSYNGQIYGTLHTHTGAWNSSDFYLTDLNTAIRNRARELDIAPYFNSTSTYSSDDIVIYEGRLYKFVDNHTGAWDDNDAVLTDIAELLNVLKNYLNATKLDSWEAAHLFQTTDSYAVGDYVRTSDGSLYRCTTAHTGAWDATHFTSIIICDELENKQNKASFSGNTLVL